MSENDSRNDSREETPTEELARLLDDAESHRLRALPFDDLRRLARLYRGESARLARLRDRGGDQDRIGHLNSLCVRAHGFLYSARKRPKRAFGRGIAISLAETARIQTLAWLLMAVGAIVGFSLVVLDPSALYALMPASLGYDTTQIDSLFRSAEARDQFLSRDATSATHNMVFGSSLFTNNTRVGILAFATGILFGIPTILLQFYNGIMIGTIGAIFLRGEHAVLFLAWILPHAIPELTAITLCSAGGLVLGRAMAAPGRVTRTRALQTAAPTALALFLTSLPLFFVAAWIESFVRESTMGTAARFAVAGVGFLVLGGSALLLRGLRHDESMSTDWLDDLARGELSDATG